MPRRYRFTTQLQIWKEVRRQIKDDTHSCICPCLNEMITKGQAPEALLDRCLSRVEATQDRERLPRFSALWEIGDPNRLRWIDRRIAACSSRKRLRGKKK